MGWLRWLRGASPEHIKALRIAAWVLPILALAFVSPLAFLAVAWLIALVGYVRLVGWAIRLDRSERENAMLEDAWQMDWSKR